jgi:DNA polymerase-3 subunit delta'
MKLAPWLDAAWRALADALGGGRLHHALLLAAPRGYGKRALADAFAAAALCPDRDADGHACGRCRSCLLVAAGSHPDLVRVTFELRDDGKPRSELTIDQMRALCQRLALSSQFGGLQIALIDPADAMNANAANALLKTLEEPSASTVIVLVADVPERLPATVRSRCRRLELRAPSREEAIGWLGAQGVDSRAAQSMLEASLGNPGQAAAWLADGTLALREECAADLSALSAGRSRASAIAERWASDRADSRLWFAAVLAREEADALARGGRGTLGLTGRAEIPKLVAWFGRANRARGLLSTPLRAELVLLDVLRSWPAGERVSRRA